MENENEKQLLEETKRFLARQEKWTQEKLEILEFNIKNGRFYYEENGVLLMRTGTEKTLDEALGYAP